MNPKLFFAIFLLATSLFADASLFEKVERVGVTFGGYTLGKVLNAGQKSIAEKNREQANVAGTYKFRDGDLHIVADRENDRVVLLYQTFDMVDSERMKQLVSRCIGAFEEPTTVTHNNIIYWFYHEEGHKITLEAFEAWRAKMNPDAKGAAESSLAALLKSGQGDDRRLHQLVTVKFSTTKPIFSKEEKYLDASAYLMVSSEPLISANYPVIR